MKRIALIFSGLLMVFICSSCASYKYSNKHKGEKLTVKLKDTRPVIDNTKLLAQASVVSRGQVDLIGRVIDYAAAGVKKLILLSKKNLTVEYSSGIKNLYFYEKPSLLGITDPNGMNFIGLDIERRVQIKGNEELAFSMSFSVDTSSKNDIINNSLFRLKLDSLKVNYAKAKIPGCKWYMPWTVFWAGKKNKKLNMDVEIIFVSTWMDEGFVIHKNVEIGRFLLNLRNIPLDKNDPNYASYFDKLKGTYLDGFCFLVPRSYGFYPDGQRNLNPCWGQGIYDVYVNIKESGKEKFITKVSDNSGGVIDELNKILKEAYKK